MRWCVPNTTDTYVFICFQYSDCTNLSAQHAQLKSRLLHHFDPGPLGRVRRHLPGILCVWTPLVRVRRGCIDRLPNHRRRDRHFLHAHGRTRARHHRNCRLHSPDAQGRAQLGRLLERRDGEEVSSLLPGESRFIQFIISGRRHETVRNNARHDIFLSSY